MCLCAPSYAAGGALVPVLDVTRKPASLWVNTLREFTLNEVKSIFWVKRTRVLVKWIQNNTTVLTCYKTTVLVCRREALRNLPVSQLHRLQQNKLFSQHFMRKDSPGGLNLKFARESWNNKMLMWHAFSLVGETGAPGESLASTERTCNLHKRSCNFTSCFEEKVLATEPPALVLWPCQCQTGLRVIHTDCVMSRSGFCVLLLCFRTEFGNHPFF